MLFFRVEHWSISAGFRWNIAHRNETEDGKYKTEGKSKRFQNKVADKKNSIFFPWIITN